MTFKIITALLNLVIASLARHENRCDKAAQKLAEKQEKLLAREAELQNQSLQAAALRSKLEVL